MIYCRYPNDEFFLDPNWFFEKWLWGDFVGKHFSILTISHRKFFTHATPTLFNAGTPHPQMSSCFLLKMQGDSIDGIYDTLKQCAVISKSAGGIGVAATWRSSKKGCCFFIKDSLFVEEWRIIGSCICHPNFPRWEPQLKASPTEVSNIRASGSYIRGTNGWSNGLVPMLRNFNETARYVDQGRGYVLSLYHHHLWMSLGPAFRPTIFFSLPPKDAFITCNGKLCFLFDMNLFCTDLHVLFRGGGKRKGALAVYLEPWHADVFEFLELRKNHGKEEQRARPGKEVFSELRKRWRKGLFGGVEKSCCCFLVGFNFGVICFIGLLIVEFFHVCFYICFLVFSFSLMLAWFRFLSCLTQ